jgi:hypothetical protein
MNSTKARYLRNDIVTDIDTLTEELEEALKLIDDLKSEISELKDKIFEMELAAEDDK